MMSSLLVLHHGQFLLHSALHGDEAFLVEELFHHFVVFGTLRDARDGLVALRLVLVLVLVTTELVVRMLHIHEHFARTLLVHVTTLLLRLQFATLGVLGVVGVGEHRLGVTLGVGVGALGGVLFATLQVGGGLVVSQGEGVFTLAGVGLTLFVFRVLGTTDDPVLALLLGRVGEHVFLAVRQLAPLLHVMVDTALGIGVALGVVLLLGLARFRVRLTLLGVSSTTHLMVGMLGVPVHVLVTALRLVLVTTGLVVQGSDVLPALLAALSLVLGHVTAQVVVLVSGVLEDLLGATLGLVLLAALCVVRVVHVLEHLLVTLGTAGQTLVVDLGATLFVHGRFGVVDVLDDVTLGSRRVSHTQLVGLEGALEVLATLHSVGILLVGSRQDALENHVLSTTGSELLVFLLGHLEHGGALVFRRGGRGVITETALEELGTTGLVQGLVLFFNIDQLGGALVSLVQVLALAVLFVVLLAALVLQGGLQGHVLG